MCNQVGQTGIGAPGCWVDGYYSLNYTQIYLNFYIYIYKIYMCIYILCIYIYTCMKFFLMKYFLNSRDIGKD